MFLEGLAQPVVPLKVAVEVGGDAARVGEHDARSARRHRRDEGLEGADASADDDEYRRDMAREQLLQTRAQRDLRSEPHAARVLHQQKVRVVAVQVGHRLV